MSFQAARTDAPIATNLNQQSLGSGVYPFVPIRPEAGLSGGDPVKIARIVMMMALLVGGTGLIASAQDNGRWQDNDHDRQSAKRDRDRDRNGDRDRDAAEHRRDQHRRDRDRDADRDNDRGRWSARPDPDHDGDNDAYRGNRGNGNWGYGNGGYRNRGYGNGGYYGRNSSVGQARQFGYQDGYNDGLRDRQTGHSFRPTQDSNYQHATNGYNSSLGDQNQYKQNYRQSYSSGYQNGYYGNGR
jgi:hypothetical protein